MSEIAYQNKDVTLKFLTEALKHKSLGVYGLPHIRIRDAQPTNLPAIEANELRLDNLFILEDNSLALIDYESTFSMEDVVKYVNYVARILKRFCRENTEIPILHLIIIFSADIQSIKTEIYDFGCMKLCIEPAFLTDMDTEHIYNRLKAKINSGEKLNDEELLEIIVLPLTVEGKKPKQELVKNTVELAKGIADENQMIQALAGIITFADKVIDKEYADYVKGAIMMTKVAQLIFDEGLEKGIEQGIEKGIDQGIERGRAVEAIRCIRIKMDKGYEAAVIADLLEQKVDYVEKVCSLIRANPKDTDAEIDQKCRG